MVSPIKTRKRKKLGSVQELNKRERNRGMEYNMYRGKGARAEAKNIGPPCRCLKQCFQLISEENIQNIFTNFWSMNCYDTQNAYLEKV